MRKTALLLAALMLLSGCSKAESSLLTEEEKLESELEKYTDENPYCFLPDGVDLDDTEHVRELEPNGENYISFEKMGVRFPYAGKTYLYEHDPQGEKFSNIFCTAALIVTSDFFPELSDYVMIQPFTDFEPYIISYKDAVERHPADTPTLRTETDYLERVRTEIKMLAPFIAAHEVMYCYDFLDIPANSNLEDPSEDDFEYPVEYNSDFLYLGISYGSTSHKWIPPETERSEPKYETMELPDGRFAVKICYTQKRYGIEAEKEVYWIYCNGNSVMHRVEFSHSPGSEQLFDPGKFLSQLELSNGAAVSEDGEVYGSFNYFLE